MSLLILLLLLSRSAGRPRRLSDQRAPQARTALARAAPRKASSPTPIRTAQGRDPPHEAAAATALSSDDTPSHQAGSAASPPHWRSTTSAAATLAHSRARAASVAVRVASDGRARCCPLIETAAGRRDSPSETASASNGRQSERRRIAGLPAPPRLVPRGLILQHLRIAMRGWQTGPRCCLRKPSHDPRRCPLRHKLSLPVHHSRSMMRPRTWLLRRRTRQLVRCQPSPSQPRFSSLGLSRQCHAGPGAKAQAPVRARRQRAPLCGRPRQCGQSRRNLALRLARSTCRRREQTFSLSSRELPSCRRRGQSFLLWSRDKHLCHRRGPRCLLYSHEPRSCRRQGQTSLLALHSRR
jgi:hypothetical protein